MKSLNSTICNIVPRDLFSSSLVARIVPDILIKQFGRYFEE